MVFRRAEPTVRQTDFLPRAAGPCPADLPDVSWFTAQRRAGGLVGRFAEPGLPVGGGAAGSAASPPNHHVLMLFHAGTEARHFILPPLARGIAWRLFVNTAAESPADIYPALDGPPPPSNDIITVPARSLMVFVAHDAAASRASDAAMAGS